MRKMRSKLVRRRKNARIMWSTVFRYIVAFKGDILVLNGDSSVFHDVAKLYSSCHIVHENIMSIDITNMRGWKI